MVLDDKVKQIGGFLLNAGIDIRAIKSLIDGTESALEALVLFLTEETIEIVFHRLHDRDRLVILQHETCRAAGCLYNQATVIVTVKSVQGVGIVCDDMQHVLSGIADHLLLFQSSGQQIDHLLQLNKSL